MQKIRTRYAPSPTGYQHIGNIRTALYTFLLARKNQGDFILRIEDTDQERYVPEAVELIYKTLRSIGLNYDEGPDVGGNHGPYIQSERRAIYQEQIKKLIDLDGAYYCFCTKERLEALKEEQTLKKIAYKYDGHCRNLSKEEIDAELTSGKPFVIRQKVPREGTTSFTDLVFGTIEVKNSELDDSVLIKSDGLPTYNFANVVDDHTMEITHVVRGSEYLSSTPKYNLIYQSFKWQIPAYVHLSPIMKTSQKKLSKREGDPSYDDLLNMGYLREAVINYIALLGWNPKSEKEIFSLDELIEAFDVNGLQKTGAIFDIKKLNWFNQQYIIKMSLEQFAKVAEQFYPEDLKNSGLNLNKVAEILHNRTEILTQIPESADFFTKLSDYDPQLFVNEKMKSTPQSALDVLEKTLAKISPDNWNFEYLKNLFDQIITETGYGKGQVLWPARIALSGKQFTPGGAYEIGEILGYEQSKTRLQTAIEKLRKII